MVISFKKIDKKRKEKGISVTEFAKDIGISRKTYYDWEKEVVPILVKYLKPIEGVLCISIEDITEEDKGKLPDAVLQGLSVDVNKILKRVQWVINHIITENHLSNVKLAKMLNISVSTMDNYRGGKSTPKPETLAVLQNLFKVSVDWIMDGRGDAFLNTNEAIKDVVDNEKYTGAPKSDAMRDTMPGYGLGEYVFIKQVNGNISAGGGLQPDNSADMRLAFRKEWFKKKGDPQNMSLIKVGGDSMEPTLLSGDLVLVDHSRNTIASQDGIYAISIDHEILIKRLHLLYQDGKILVISDNKQYPPQEISVDKITINGKVIWYAREIER